MTWHVVLADGMCALGIDQAAPLLPDPLPEPSVKFYAARSDDALDLLNTVGDLYDVGFSQ